MRKLMIGAGIFVLISTAALAGERVAVTFTPANLVEKAAAGNVDALAVAAAQWVPARPSLFQGETRARVLRPDPALGKVYARKACDAGHPLGFWAYSRTLKTNAEREPWLRKAADAGCEIAFAELADLLVPHAMPKESDKPDLHDKAVVCEGYAWAALAALSPDKTVAAAGVTVQSRAEFRLARFDANYAVIGSGDKPSLKAAKEEFRKLRARFASKFPAGLPRWEVVPEPGTASRRRP